MHPEVEIFGRTVPTYGLMAAAGIVCGLLFVLFRARSLKLDAVNSIYMYTFGFIGAGVGAKILYLLVSIDDVIRDFKYHGFIDTLIGYAQGGLVFYGGLIGAIVAAHLTARYLKEDITLHYPALVPGIAILAGFGRIGCFLAGCCYGARTDSHLCVVFPAGSQAPSGIPLVPIQLYEAAFEFIAVIVFFGLGFIGKLRPYLLYIYCASYAVLRFILEFWRGDQLRGVYGPFSTSQWISIAVLLFVVVKGIVMPLCGKIKAWR